MHIGGELRELWIILLHCILELCRERRGGAISNLFPLSYANIFEGIIKYVK
jgi:hypothetical protein